MKVRKIVALILALALVFGLAACGEGSTGSSGNDNSADSPENGANAPAESEDEPEAAWEPKGSIDFVCPYSAGGGSDVCARTIASIMGNYCPANCVVQNLTGGGGLVGTSYVYGKKGDDMTLCTYAPGQLGSAIANSSECGWDAMTQICVLALEEQTLVVQPGKFKDLQDLIDYSVAHPGEVTLAGTSFGNEDHMCVEMLNRVAGANVTYVTYDSAGDIITAILGGHITGGICNPSEDTSQVNAGTLDCLCSFGEDDIHYIAGFENVPTAKSYGYDIVFTMFRGIAGPPGMSDEALAYWVDVFKQVSEDPAWTDDYVAAKGLKPVFIVGEELQTFLQNQYDMYYDLQKSIGLI